MSLHLIFMHDSVFFSLFQVEILYTAFLNLFYSFCYFGTSVQLIVHLLCTLKHTMLQEPGPTLDFNRTNFPLSSRDPNPSFSYCPFSFVTHSDRAVTLTNTGLLRSTTLVAARGYQETRGMGGWLKARLFSCRVCCPHVYEWQILTVSYSKYHELRFWRKYWRVSPRLICQQEVGGHCEATTPHYRTDLRIFAELRTSSVCCPADVPGKR